MQDPIEILIVEDEILIAEDVKELLEEVGYSHIHKARSYESAMEVLLKNQIHLIIADINLSGGLTGVDLGNTINSKHHIPFIYLTSYSDKETIGLAKQTNPSAFIVKPFTKSQLLASVEIAMQDFSESTVLSRSPAGEDDENHLTASKQQSNDFVFKSDLVIKSDYKFIKIPLSEILWFESDKNYVTVETIYKSYIIRSSLKSILKQLPKDLFVKCHKQFIINITHVKSFSSSMILINERKLPVSRNNQKNVIQKLIQ